MDESNSHAGVGLGLVSKGVDGMTKYLEKKRAYYNEEAIYYNSYSFVDEGRRLSRGIQKHSKWYVVVVCGFRIRSRVRNWVRVIG